LRYESAIDNPPTGMANYQNANVIVCSNQAVRSHDVSSRLALSQSETVFIRF
jgi:hypothetical protein